MSAKVISKRNAQLVVVLLCAVAIKLYYSTASVNQLRWILAPTTAAVELISDSRFEFESHAGYINSERSFVIAAPCAGINFLITAFLLLSLRRLWEDRPQAATWSFIACAALCAYLATLVANTVRISTALLLKRAALETGWLNQNQIHRLEGILVYFGFLLLLFVISERTRTEHSSRSAKFGDLLRQSCFPLLIYYATTLGMPLANGAYHQGAIFWEHSLFVLLTPLPLILALAAYLILKQPLARTV